jgi:hypothetical protein
MIRRNPRSSPTVGSGALLLAWADGDVEHQSLANDLADQVHTRGRCVATNLASAAWVIPLSSKPRSSESSPGSSEIAADRVLHVQRFLSHSGSSPWRSRASVAAPRAVERTPPATSPRRPGRTAGGLGSTGPCPTPGPGPARTGPGRCQAGGTDLLDPLGQVRTDGRLGTAHTMVPLRADQSSAQECDSACSGEASLHGRPRRRWARAIIERLLLPKQMGASPTVIPPEYRQNPPALGDGHDPSTARPMLHPRCSALLESDEWRVERTAKLHPFMASAGGEGWWGGLVPVKGMPRRRELEGRYGLIQNLFRSNM